MSKAADKKKQKLILKVSPWLVVVSVRMVVTAEVEVLDCCVVVSDTGCDDGLEAALDKLVDVVELTI